MKTAGISRSALSHWTELWQQLNATGDPEPWHRRLVAAYTEGSRHYHNLRHLEECLTEFDAVRTRARRPAEVEIALWFHDAVYDPKSATNEEDSGQLATTCLASAGVPSETIEAVRQLILSTKTHEPASEDAALLVDVDLAILGQAPKRFWEYEQAIKAEYAWVPSSVFATKRAEILTRFLQRPSIYRTAPLRLKYEAAARANLQTAIAKLQ